MLEWRKTQLSGFEYLKLFYNGRVVGYLEPRPTYCDRGRWRFLTDLPNTDWQDGFPRYYMNLERAKAEAEEWTEWKISRDKVTK